MLRDWTYAMEAEPLPSEDPASHPEFTDVERNDENELSEIGDDVILNLSQEIQQKKTKMSRKQRNDQRKQVILVFSQIVIFSVVFFSFFYYFAIYLDKLNSRFGHFVTVNYTTVSQCFQWRHCQ